MNFREQFNLWNEVVYSVEPGIRHVLASYVEKFQIFGDKKTEIIKRVRLDLICLLATGEY